MIVLGIMNGTSADGIDYVWAQISHKGAKIAVKFLKQEHKSFSAPVRDKILLAIANKLPTHELGQLHHDLGREYARHYSQLKGPKTQLIGLHGQTVFHKGQSASLQIGEPSYLALQAKVSVAFNFRAADVAQGGHGAPLAPLFHQILLHGLSQKKAVAFHNLGGISNLTYCHKKTILAFDTGPASTLMDSWLQLKTKGEKMYDDSGKIAARGLPHTPSLKKMLATPYFKKPAPKSCGREEFNLDFIKNSSDARFSSLALEDQMSTLTELTAASIHQAYEKLPSMPEKIFFSGGGVHNEFLLHRLKIYFNKTEVLTSNDLGWPASAIEGGAFATLAYLRFHKMRCDLKTITGGKNSTLLGQMCEI